MAKSGKVKGQVLGGVRRADHQRLTAESEESRQEPPVAAVRQNGDVKRWRVSASLSYARSADIQFEDSPGKEAADTEVP